MIFDLTRRTGGGGGEWTTEGLATASEPKGAITITANEVADGAFAGKRRITAISLPNATYLGISAFDTCDAVSSFSAPRLQRANQAAFRKCGDGQASLFLPAFTTCEATGVFRTLRFPVVVMPSIVNFYGYAFEQNALLEKIDLGSTLNSLPNQNFVNCRYLTTIILRRSSAPVALANTNVFNGTPFTSGGTGGTIYIPKALYDHLGDGTANDYKAATNWSTIDGYGTITWAKIEGSIYENAYADGTPIT